MKLIFDDNMNVTYLLNQNIIMASKETEVSVDSTEVSMDVSTSMGGDMGIEDGIGKDGYMESTVKDPVLSSWPAVIGISAATIILGLALGILLAKKKIKKGIELYED